MFEQILRQPPIESSTLYIDMDSFFASVEQQYNSRLRGRPIGVCPFVGEGSAVVAASVEAKKAGVRAGMRARDARAICPDIQFVTDSPARYRVISQAVMAVLNSTPAEVVQKGIDESYLKLPSYLTGSASAYQFAYNLKNAIRNVVGEYIGCSIGIAPNIWLAKMCASANKPDGLAEMTISQLTTFYAGLKLTDLTGISHRLARQCYGRGIYSVEDLFGCSLPVLRAFWGVNGVKWYLRLRGYEVDTVIERPQQSISHQTTIMPAPAVSRAELAAVLTKMSYKLGMRLRANNQMARGVWLHLRYEDKSSFSANRVSPQFMSSNYEISLEITAMLEKLENFRPVRRVYMGLYHLSNGLQLSFDGFDIYRRKRQVSEVIDQLNSRYGPGTLVPGSSVGRAIFPDRIGFGRG